MYQLMLISNKALRFLKFFGFYLQFQHVDLKHEEEGLLVRKYGKHELRFVNYPQVKI